MSADIKRTEGGICRERDALGVTELLQWDLRKTGVHLNLIYGRNDLAVGQQRFQGLDREVGHADRPDLACVYLFES